MRRFRIDTTEKMERVVKISTVVVFDAATANAPRRSGRLRRSIRTKVGKDQPVAGHPSKALEFFRLGERIRVFWTSHYAHIQERGGKSRRGRRIVGKRFVARAVKQWPAIVARVAERVSKE